MSFISELWQWHCLCLQWVEAREKFEAAANLIDAEHRMRKTMWGQFWSAHQRFFKYLCISAKVHHCVHLADEAVRSGKVLILFDIFVYLLTMMQMMHNVSSHNLIRI